MKKSGTLAGMGIWGQERAFKMGNITAHTYGSGDDPMEMGN